MLRRVRYRQEAIDSAASRPSPAPFPTWLPYLLTPSGTSRTFVNWGALRPPRSAVDLQDAADA